MIDGIVRLIIEKQIKFSDVSKHYKRKVKAMLEKMGLDENGDPIETDVQA